MPFNQASDNIVLQASQSYFLRAWKSYGWFVSLHLIRVILLLTHAWFYPIS